MIAPIFRSNPLISRGLQRVPQSKTYLVAVAVFSLIALGVFYRGARYYLSKWQLETKAFGLFQQPDIALKSRIRNTLASIESLPQDQKIALLNLANSIIEKIPIIENDNRLNIIKGLISYRFHSEKNLKFKTGTTIRILMQFSGDKNCLIRKASELKHVDLLTALDYLHAMQNLDFVVDTFKKFDHLKGDPIDKLAALKDFISITNAQGSNSNAFSLLIEQILKGLNSLPDPSFGQLRNYFYWALNPGKPPESHRTWRR